jgi:hypothetical protein
MFFCIEGEQHFPCKRVDRCYLHQVVALEDYDDHLKQNQPCSADREILQKMCVFLEISARHTQFFHVAHLHFLHCLLFSGMFCIEPIRVARKKSSRNVYNKITLNLKIEALLLMIRNTRLWVKFGEKSTLLMFSRCIL